MIEASYRHWIKRAHDELKHETVDKERAVRTVEGLRALLAAARAREPAPPPLLHDD